jgi:phosphoglycolate phosphatase
VRSETALKVDALLFDLDGTLVDTREDILGSVNHALAAVGRPPRRLEEVTDFIGDGALQLMERSLGPSDPAVLRTAHDLFIDHYEAHCTDRSVLYPGVRELLGRLARRPLAVVTNKPMDHTRRLLKALGVDVLFREVVAGDSLPVRKPRPEPLLEAARRLGSVPARTLMVGDSAIDVVAGKAAGMLTCAVTGGYRPVRELEEAGPDLVLGDLAELDRRLEAV